MERRLNIVLEGCLSPEELEARKNNKFGLEKKRLVDLLTKIHADITERDNIVKRQGKCQESIVKNAQARSALGKAKKMLDSLQEQVSIAAVRAKKKPNPEREKVARSQKASYQHAEKLYANTLNYFNANSTDSAAAVDRELSEGIDTTLVASRPSTSSSSSSSSSLYVGGSGPGRASTSHLEDIELQPYQPSQYEDQFQQLLTEEQQMEEEYAEKISEQLNKLSELVNDASLEMDKQEVLMSDIEQRMDKQNDQLSTLNGRIDRVNEVAKQSNRTLYIIIIIIVLAIAGVLVLKFLL